MGSSRLPTWALALGGVAAGAAAVGWLLRRPAPTSLEHAASANPVDELPPASFTLEPSPVSERQVTARPRRGDRYAELADDYGSIAPEDLGVAFLAGATETPLEQDPPSTAEIDGFQIFEPSEREQLPDPELDSIFGRDS